LLPHQGKGGRGGRCCCWKEDEQGTEKKIGRPWELLPRERVGAGGAVPLLAEGRKGAGREWAEGGAMAAREIKAPWLEQRYPCPW
jgi:hypothetical protein